MAIEIDGKVYRNLEEQVRKNQEDIKELGGGSELTIHERVAKLEEDVEALTSLVNAIKEKTDYIKIADGYFTIDLENKDLNFTVRVGDPQEESSTISLSYSNYSNKWYFSTDRINANSLSLADDDAIIQIGSYDLEIKSADVATCVLGI